MTLAVQTLLAGDDAAHIAMRSQWFSSASPARIRYTAGLTGTALRPVRSALDDAGWHKFTTQLAPLLGAAYPRRSDGTTWLPSSVRCRAEEVATR
ncbi:hypothetical protein [Nocardia sp. NBC_01730]|uniref:hypothetical protein n=1 Tax=Nocardia sp. NBC_01730 TaxID=2975998 RepID=UPI003FA3722B